MTINEMMAQIDGIQGPVKVIGIKDGREHIYIDCIANWCMEFYDEPLWAETDITYIYVKDGELIIEIEEM